MTEPHSRDAPADSNGANASQTSRRRHGLGARGAGRQRTQIAAAGLIGLVFGVFIGLNLRPPAAPLCPDLAPTAAGTASSMAPGSAAPRPPAVDLDLGSDGGRPSLLGTWTPLADPDGRTAAAAPSPARLRLAANRQGATEVVAIVGKLTGVEPGQALSVVAAIRGHRLATWTWRSEWGLYSAPWPRALKLERDATLALTLPAPADAGAEAGDVAIAVDHLLIGPAAAAAQIDLRTAEGRSRLLRGFWQVEDDAQGGEPAVWSRGRRSTVGLVLAPVAGDYSLALRAGAFDAIAPVDVTVELNGKSLGTQPIDALGDYVFTVPHAALSAGANAVALVYAKTGRPADHGAGDPRELAVRLFHLALTPVGS